MRKKILIVGVLLGLCFHNVEAQNQNDNFRESYIAPKITFALAGDAIITRKISPYQEPQFLSMINIIRDADVAFVNCEMLFFNYKNPNIYPAANSGGTWMHAPPEMVKQLKWAGFDICSTATNHSMDFGIQGLIANIKSLKKYNLVNAGTGMNLGEALAPAYFESDAGRVALISVASTFSSDDPAGPQTPYMKGRPGLAPLLYNEKYVITGRSLKDLKQFSKESGFQIKELEDGVRFLGEHFVIGKKNKGKILTVNKENLNAILASVKEANRQADWVIVNSHTHEGDGVTPPEFLIQFAHAVIDAGADVVAVEGHHSNRPIEIYKGRPIFYSLADFMFQNETVKKLPGDFAQRYNVSKDSLPGYLQDIRIEEQGAGSFVNTKGVWQSFIAVPTFRNVDSKDKAGLISLKLYPITLGFGAPRSQRGRPRLANKEQGRAIIEKLKEMSKPFGTKIKYDAEKNIGIVILDSSSGK